MINSTSREEDLCAGDLAQVCPVRPPGTWGHRAGKGRKTGKGAFQQRSPRRQRQPDPAGDSGG